MAKNKFGKQFQKIKMFDAFGHDIQLNYRGEGAYRTYFGTICTILLAMIISVHFLEIGLEYMEEGNISLFYSQSYFDRVEGEAYNLAESGIEIFVLPMFH